MPIHYRRRCSWYPSSARIHETYEWLLSQGFKPLLHKMDNHTLYEVKKFIQAQQTRLRQYTPPDMHRTNPSERVIRTWKNHFLAGIAGLPKSFPIANWCRLTRQWDATLNMLRPALSSEPPPFGPRST